MARGAKRKKTVEAETTTTVATASAPKAPRGRRTRKNMSPPKDALLSMFEAEVWPAVKEACDRVFKMERISLTESMGYYTKVYDFGIINTDGNQADKSANRYQLFYGKIEPYLREKISGIASELSLLQGETLLRRHEHLYGLYHFQCKVINWILRYINNHWLKSPGPERFTIYGVGMIIWRETVFDPISPMYSTATMELILRDRTGELSDRSILQSSVRFVLNLNADIVESSSLTGEPRLKLEKEKMELYMKLIEPQFLEETFKFYSSEGQTFLADHTVPEYVRKVDSILKDEADRIERFLHRSTSDALNRILTEVLIIRPMDLLHQEFRRALHSRSVEELRAVYGLVARTENELPKLYDVLKNFMVKYGSEKFENQQKNFLEDPIAYVDLLLEIYAFGKDLVQTALGGQKDFGIALRKGMDILVNDNLYVETFPNPRRKAAELLALCSDIWLKKGGKQVDANDLEKRLDDLISLFVHLLEKDVFEEHYRQRLAKRLIHGHSSSDDDEALMIAKLKANTGFEYTQKMHKMITDIKVSRDVNAAFKDRMLHSARVKLNCDMSAMVLSQGSWPLSGNTSVNPIMPPELERPLMAFMEYYTKANSGRKLCWLHMMSKMELSTSCFKLKHIFTVTVPQACVLLAFNDTLEMTAGTLRSNVLKGEVDVANQIIVGLIKTQVLKVAGKDKNVTEADVASDEAVVQLNLGFRSNKVRLSIVQPIRTEQAKEEKKVDEDIDENRQGMLQATIVRILKMRKVLKHSQLIAEIVEQTKNRFQPSVPMIKKSIERLIEKDYMKRSDKERDSYEYIA